MAFISRIREKVFKPTDTRPDQPAPQAQNLCSRCQDLDLSTYIERPWAACHPLNEDFHIAIIEEHSIDDSCVLCTQLAAYLPLSKQSLTLACSNKERSLELWGSHTEAFHDQDLVKTYFYIVHSDTARERCHFSTKPPRFRVPSNPQALRWKHVWLPAVGALPDLSRTCDYGKIEAWYNTCRAKHTCGQSRPDIARPKRLIDCKRRKLCDVKEPYVCLSYLWGTTKPDKEELYRVLPAKLPRTIADAMTVTLRIGLRYLWVDRYCIDQSNAEEKHDSIQHMDAICESILGLLRISSPRCTIAMLHALHQRNAISDFRVPQLFLTITLNWLT